MPKQDYSAASVPSFAEAPSVILITGDVGFFVEESAAQALAKLAGSDGEILRFDDEASSDAVSDALLNRSLFSPRRVVQSDVGRILGTETPGRLLGAAVDAWSKGTAAGRREAFRHARALLSALDLAGPGDAASLAEAAAKRTRRKEDAAVLEEILGELPSEKGGAAALQSAIRVLLERGNEGTVALLTATAPPAGVGLLAEIGRKGLVLDVSTGREPSEALGRLARARAKEREVAVDPDAVNRLLTQTNADPQMFAAELDKLLAIAGPGGRVTAADVRQNVEDAAAEDVYPFFDAIGRRDAADALTRLGRLFSDRPVRAGKRDLETDDGWPQKFLSMAAGEVRHMLLVRAALSGPGAPAFDARMRYPEFEARVLPRLVEPVAPFGRSPFAGSGGQVSAYIWYKAAQRAAKYSVPELSRALARAAALDVDLKSSIDPLEAFTLWIGGLLAGS